MQSCVQVLHAMSSDPDPITLGARTFSARFDAPLPFRYLSHDGLCAVDINNSPGVDFDTVSPLELKEAAHLLIQVCVALMPSTGGFINGLGVNKGLWMRVVPYRPTVLCGPEGSGPPWITCRNVIDVMSAGSEKQTFGPRDWDNTTVPIPFAHTTDARRCALLIYATSPGKISASADWYRLWLAANAIDYICIQLGRKGLALGQGRC